MIQAIETVYNGYRFRSRLEARWAVFFDALRIPWEYEKEGFDLGEVGKYLPDFWLPTVGLRGCDTPGIWIEIKGAKPTDEEQNKCSVLAEGTEHPAILFWDLPCSHNERDPDNDGGYQFEFEPGYHECMWDNYMIFVCCADENCGCVKIDYPESSYMYCPKCGGTASDRTSRLLTAYTAARSAHFEHGQIGTPSVWA